MLIHLFKEIVPVAFLIALALCWSGEASADLTAWERTVQSTQFQDCFKRQGANARCECTLSQCGTLAFLCEDLGVPCGVPMDRAYYICMQEFHCWDWAIGRK